MNTGIIARNVIAWQASRFKSLYVPGQTSFRLEKYFVPKLSGDVKHKCIRLIRYGCEVPTQICLFEAPRGGGGYSKKLYTGRLRPEVQPLTLLFTIFSENAPLLYTFYWKKAPLSYTFLRRLRNK